MDDNSTFGRRARTWNPEHTVRSPCADKPALLVQALLFLQLRRRQAGNAFASCKAKRGPENQVYSQDTFH